jgi:hypothetical protein
MSPIIESQSIIEEYPRVRARLPAAVYDLALRLGANPRLSSTSVRLRQNGRMRQIGDARWMAFRAKQDISTLRCAFDWRARAGPAGLITARDALIEGEGRFDVRALGIFPIVRADRTPALQRGQLMRYLAELPWAPDAILHNTELRWREDGADKLVVSAGSGETAAEVVLSLDNEGRIAGAFAPDRPRSAKPPFLPTPWRGRFSDYRRHNTMWLPFAAEVGWVIDGEEVIYWEGRIEHWERQNE